MSVQDWTPLALGGGETKKDVNETIEYYKAHWIKLVKSEISLLRELTISSFEKLGTLPGGFRILECPHLHGASDKRHVFLPQRSDILKGFLC